MNMLKDQKETEKEEREIRDLKYRLRDVILENREKIEDSINNREHDKFEDENLKKERKLLMN